MQKLSRSHVSSSTPRAAVAGYSARTRRKYCNVRREVRSPQITFSGYFFFINFFSFSQKKEEGLNFLPKQHKLYISNDADEAKRIEPNEKPHMLALPPPPLWVTRCHDPATVYNTIGLYSSRASIVLHQNNYI